MQHAACTSAHETGSAGIACAERAHLVPHQHCSATATDSSSPEHSPLPLSLPLLQFDGQGAPVDEQGSRQEVDGDRVEGAAQELGSHGTGRPVGQREVEHSGSRAAAVTGWRASARAKEKKT